MGAISEKLQERPALIAQHHKMCMDECVAVMCGRFVVIFTHMPPSPEKLSPQEIVLHHVCLLTCPRRILPPALVIVDLSPQRFLRLAMKMQFLWGKKCSDQSFINSPIKISEHEHFFFHSEHPFRILVNSL